MSRSYDDRVFRDIQTRYMQQAELYYRQHNDIADERDRSYLRLIKMVQDMQRYRHLLHSTEAIKNLSAQDFSRSDVPCTECCLTIPHHKLQAGKVLICPIDLAIKWTRLKLNGYLIADFDTKELIERSKIT